MADIHRLLSRRLLYVDRPNGKRVRVTTVRIAALGVGVGFAFILLSLFIVSGFKYEIREKINGFTGNLRIFHPDNAYGQYSHPLTVSDELMEKLCEALSKEMPGALLTPYVDQMVLLKSDSAYVGALAHGVGTDYDRHFYSAYLTKGSLPTMEKDGEGSAPELLLSDKSAETLGLSPGESITGYFFSEGRVRVRKFVLSGTFSTGYKDYDDAYALTDLQTLQTVNDWGANDYGGIEVRLPEYDQTERAYDLLYPVLYEDSKSGTSYTMYTAQDMSPVMFGWVDLLDTNVQLILILAICIAAMIMTTGIIVVILQKTHTIAILKALGMRNGDLRRSFRNLSISVIARGLIWGNVIAIGLGLLQKYGKWIKLDPTQYYMDAVPVRMEIGSLLGANLLTFVVLYVIMYIPTLVISEIKPVKVLRFE